MNLRLAAIIFSATTMALALCVCGCADDPVSSPKPVLITGRMEEFFIMPVGQVNLLRYYPSGSSTSSEPYIWWDVIVGEPFTDLNGNGVYDYGIDLFVRSQDPALNQDLNHNGVYDGPNSTWEPGDPYDDITRDNSYTSASSERLTYVVGDMPYADLNVNGVCDTNINYVPSIVGVTNAQGGNVYRAIDRFIQFESDSGGTVYAKSLSGNWPELPWVFTLDEQSVWAGPLVWLLDTGAIVEMRNSRIQDMNSQWSFYRSAEFLSTLSFQGIDYNDVLHISVRADTSTVLEGDLEFFFQREIGLILVHDVTFDLSNHRLDSVSYQLLPFEPSITVMHR